MVVVQNQMLRRTRDSIQRIEERTKQSLQRLENKIQLQRKAIVRAVASLCLPLLAIIIAVIDPVPKLGRWYMRISEGCNGYNMFEKPPIGSHNKVYIFNVTNAEQFASGADSQLRVQEVGPFTFLEYHWSSNITMDWERGVMRFIPQINVTFVPELSIGDPKDFRVIAPNIPLLSITSVVTDYSMWTNLAFNLLAQNLGSKSFRNLTADEYLWGFEDPIMKVAHTILPGFIESPKAGILQQLYEGDGKQFVEMELEIGSRYRIRSYDGASVLSHWRHNDSRSTCNNLQGSYEGLYFTPGFNQQSTFDLYRRSTCRTVPMRARNYTTTSFGVRVLNFTLEDKAFEPEINDCVCRRGNCLPKGLSDMSPCYKGVKFAMSKPHFLDCDPSVYQRVEGIHPDKVKHDTFVSIEPEMGLPLRGVSASQTNIVIGDARYITAAKPFSNMVVPIVWFHMQIEDIPSDLQLILRWRFIFGPALFTGLELLCLFVGLVISAYHVFRYIRPWGYEMDYQTVPMVEKEMQFVHSNPLLEDVDL